MARRTLTHWGAAVSLGLTVVAGQARGLGTAFTYQGQLEQSGALANGTCDLQFSLFDALSSGNQVGTTQTVTPVSVTDGLFTVPLDFGSSAFDGNDRWLQIAVRCPVGSASYTMLSPRQPLTAAPYALFAPSAGSAADLSCSGCVSPTDLASGAVTDQKVASGIAYSKLTGAPASLPPNGPAGGSLSGTYPNPTLATNSVATAQIQSAAVSPAKINSTGAASGQALVWNGSNVVWGNPPTGLNLPFAGSVSSGGDAFAITNSGQGTGVAVTANVNAVHGKSTSGVGVFGESTQFEGVRGEAADVNHGAVVGIHSNNGFAVYGQSTGTGVGVQGNSPAGKGVVGNSTTGIGVYGTSAQFEGVRGEAADPNHGAVVGIHNGGGFGVYGESGSNSGVVGRSTTGIGVVGESEQFEGVRGVATNPSYGAVVGIHNSPNGTGVAGRGGMTGGYFEGSGPQSSALALNNGGIRVVGAGAGTATPVFVHVAHNGAYGTPSNLCAPPRTNATIIDNPYANGHPDAILIVTSTNLSPAGVSPRVSYGTFSCPSDRWVVDFEGFDFSLGEGTTVNVMVINP